MADDAEARRRRAERLRRQIAGITGRPEDASPAGRGEEEAPASAPDQPQRRKVPRVHPDTPSAREFIERRMRELDRDDGTKH